jgi:uncharacterized protein YndB with AHSA1/START domain
MGQNELQLSQIPTVNTAMLIRRPPAQVFKALVDPDVTTRFWFTNSTGKLMPGAHVRWDSEMYGASADVHVKELEEDHRILIEWGEGDEFATVEFLLAPFDVDATRTESPARARRCPHGRRRPFPQGPGPLSSPNRTARTRERARLSGGGPDTASTYAFMQLDYAASQRA